MKFYITIQRQPVRHPHRAKTSSAQMSVFYTRLIQFRDNLETLINLTCMSLGSGRSLEYSERTNVYTGRTQKLNTEGELNLEPSCCEATVLTAVQPHTDHISVRMQPKTVNCTRQILQSDWNIYLLYFSPDPGDSPNFLAQAWPFESQCFEVPPW